MNIFQDLDYAYYAYKNLRQWEPFSVLSILQSIVLIGILVLLVVMCNEANKPKLRTNLLLFGLPGIVLSPFSIGMGWALGRDEDLRDRATGLLFRLVWKIFWVVQGLFTIWFFFYFVRYCRMLSLAMRYGEDAVVAFFYLITYLIYCLATVAGAGFILWKLFRGDTSGLWQYHSILFMFVLFSMPSVVVYEGGFFYIVFLLVKLFTVGMGVWFAIRLLRLGVSGGRIAWVGPEGTAASGAEALEGMRRTTAEAMGHFGDAMKKAASAVRSSAEADGHAHSPRAGRCLYCGAKLFEGERFCRQCGAEQVKPTCPHCGAEVNPGQKFCGKCGGAL